MNLGISSTTQEQNVRTCHWKQKIYQDKEKRKWHEHRSKLFFFAFSMIHFIIHDYAKLFITFPNNWFHYHDLNQKINCKSRLSALFAKFGILWLGFSQKLKLVRILKNFSEDEFQKCFEQLKYWLIGCVATQEGTLKGIIATNFWIFIPEILWSYLVF